MIGLIIVVVLIGFFFALGIMAGRDYYHGVYVPRLARQRQFDRRRNLGPGCHIGPGRSCDSCLLNDKCYAHMVETVKRDIDDALSHLRKTINQPQHQPGIEVPNDQS